MLDEEGVAKTLQRFEERGEEGVRQDLAQGLYGEHSSEKVHLAKFWLSEKAEEREMSDRNAAVDREERLVALAGKANNIATSANWMSMVALIVAGLALLKSFGVI